MKGTLQYTRTIDYIGLEFTEILQTIFGKKQQISFKEFKKRCNIQPTELAGKDAILMTLCRKNYLWPADDPVNNFIGICTRANRI
jgi:hypothetical protein